MRRKSTEARKRRTTTTTTTTMMMTMYVVDVRGETASFVRNIFFFFSLSPLRGAKRVPSLEDSSSEQNDSSSFSSSRQPRNILSPPLSPLYKETKIPSEKEKERQISHTRDQRTEAGTPSIRELREILIGIPKCISCMNPTRRSSDMGYGAAVCVLGDAGFINPHQTRTTHASPRGDLGRVCGS